MSTSNEITDAQKPKTLLKTALTVSYNPVGKHYSIARFSFLMQFLNRPQLQYKKKIAQS